ncbi:hypothetical protein [Nonomuraea sp. GTA35]|uniref:hypothetical protein n=1 Tax=Nonomuraea sp. GTA35 TaxID=1676746 RepID=UPI0035BF908A
MIAAGQAVVAAYVAGVVGILVGVVIAATYRSDRRRRRTEDGREIHPPLRVDQLLRDELGEEADRLTREWDSQQRGDR